MPADGVRRPRINVIGMKEVSQGAIQGIGGVGKAALLCLGILAMLALAVVMSVLTAHFAFLRFVVWSMRALSGASANLTFVLSLRWSSSSFARHVYSASSTTSADPSVATLPPSL